jgi:hypothetical protein
MGLIDDLYEYLTDEELKAAAQRMKIQVIDEVAALRAPGHRKAKRPEDRIVTPEAIRLFGKDYTRRQVTDLAIQRTIDAEKERGVLSEEQLRDLMDAINKMLASGREWAR